MASVELREQRRKAGLCPACGGAVAAQTGAGRRLKTCEQCRRRMAAAYHRWLDKRETRQVDVSLTPKAPVKQPVVRNIAETRTITPMSPGAARLATAWVRMRQTLVGRLKGSKRVLARSILALMAEIERGA